MVVEHVFRELPALDCDLHQTLGWEGLQLMCTILLKRNLDKLFNDDYWYQRTWTERELLQRRTAILTAIAFMDNTLERKERIHYAREILARITSSDQLLQFTKDDIDNILRTYRDLYYPLNFFRSAVRELGNINHWNLDFTEKKLYKSYEMKCLNYNHNGEQWCDKSFMPQTMYGTGPYSIININWNNYDFGK